MMRNVIAVQVGAVATAAHAVFHLPAAQFTLDVTGFFTPL